MVSRQREVSICRATRGGRGSGAEAEAAVTARCDVRQLLNWFADG